MEKVRRRVHARHDLAVVLKPRFERASARGARKLLVLAVRLVETFLVDGKPILRRHLDRHLEREAEGVVELERRLAADLRLAVELKLLGDLLVHRLSLVESRVEALLLGLKV